MKHAELVEASRKWLLKKGCSIAISELTTCSQLREEPDAIGWIEYKSILVECKTNLDDMRADMAKHFRYFNNYGVGDLRYYCVPSGLYILPLLLKAPELELWGILEYDAEKKKMKETRKAQPFVTVNHKHEIGLLVSALRRLGAKKADHIRGYVHNPRTKAAIDIDIEDLAD